MKTSSKRFDFGVPLEDIFPLNEIHPRLKFLFSEAYQSYIQSHLTVDELLTDYQDPLEIKLEFKEHLVYDKQYGCLSSYLPGTYFWLIRHFLGLLPIPLLPNSSNGIMFDWKLLSESCKDYFKHYHDDYKKKANLDYHLAKSLNMLPFEHFILFNVLVCFIRKVAQRDVDYVQLNRKKLIKMIKFYCGSIFNRPYRPGYGIEDKQMSPLFIYLVLRWPHISKFSDKIGYSIHFLENSDKRTTRDNWVQTTLFNPDIITIYRNMPTIYLKEIGSQTESHYTTEKGIQISTSEENLRQKNKKIKQANSNPFVNNNSYDQDTSHEDDTISYLKQDVQSVIGSEHDHHKTNEVDINEMYGNGEENNSENLTENSELYFFSVLDSSRDDNWTKVVNETLETVKKVEGYIYDDYETFSKEDFNQITVKPSLLRKLTKMDRMSPNNSPRKTTQEEYDNLEQSYLKFGNSIDGDFKEHVANETATVENIADNSLNITFKSCYSSDNNLCSSRVNSSRFEGKNKTNFNLRRFKIKMDFLRILSPKRSSPLKPTYDYCTSNVNYKKMKNCRANTL